MKIAIATSSSEKIKGIKKAFSRFFKIAEAEILVYSSSTNSGVSDQPFNSETYIGARNRVDNIKKKMQNCDFYVSCEAGIESFEDIFFNVQVICIFEAKSQRYLYGKSAGWMIPSEDIKIIKESNLDNYLKSKGIFSSEQLLGPDFSRNEAIAQATELALYRCK